MDKIAQKIKDKLNLKEFQVTNVIDLIDAGNTIPFIARYRKEMTGNLSDDIRHEYLPSDHILHIYELHHAARYSNADYLSVQNRT